MLVGLSVTLVSSDCMKGAVEGGAKGEIVEFCIHRTND